MVEHAVKIRCDDGDTCVFIFPGDIDGALAAIQEAIWVSLDDDIPGFKQHHVYQLLLQIQRLMGCQPIQSSAKYEILLKGIENATTDPPDA